MRRDEPVSRVMTACPQTVAATQTVGELRLLLRNEEIHHLPVVDGKKLVGMVSSASAFVRV